MPGCRTRILNLVLLISSVIFSIVAVEFLLSIFKPAPNFYKLNFVAANDRLDESYTLSPNPKLVYMPLPDCGGRNKYGHRGETFAFQKGKEKRIVVLGDSVTEGLRGVLPEERFTEILNKKLGAGYQVINLGVPGYNFIQEAEYLKELGLKFRPDYVFWGICLNDFDLLSVEIYSLDQRLQEVEKNDLHKNIYIIQNNLDSALLRFNLYRYLKYRLRGYSRADLKKSAEKISNFKIEEMAGLLDSLGALSKKYGFQQVFIFLPIDHRKYYDPIILEIEGLLEERSIKYLDLDRYISKNFGSEYKDSLLSDGWHLSRKGHQVVAELIYSALKGWLK